MAYIHDKADLGLPAPIADPIRVMHDRARLFVNVPDALRSNRIISKDMQTVLKGLEDVIHTTKLPSTLEAAKVLDSKQRRLASSLPPSLSGAVVKEYGDLEGALKYWYKALEEDPNDSGVAYEVANILTKMNRKSELKKFVRESSVDASNKTYFLLHADDNEGVIATANDVLANDPADQVARINRAIALKRLGRLEEMEEELTIVKKPRPREHVQAGIAALEGNKDEMLKLLDIALAKRLITIEDVLIFPVFEDYREDKNLQKLVEMRKQLESR